MSDEKACERHDLERLPNGYDECPYCREERQQEAIQAERAVNRSRTVSQGWEPY